MFDLESLPETFTIPAVNLPDLQDKIAKLNRRAKRLSCAPIMLTIGPVFTAEKSQTTIWDGAEKTRKIRVPCHTVTIAGTRPKLPGGWTLVARIQLVENTTFVHCVPGETVPHKFHSVGNRCDHCNQSRLRNDVFILRNDENKHIVVGRTCIADFLGGISPTQLAWYAESLNALDLREFESFSSGGFGGTASQFDVERYITASATAIRLGGWMSKKAAQIADGGWTTCDMAKDAYRGKLFLTPDGKPTTEEFTRYGSLNPKATVTEEDEKEAQAAISWAQAIDPEIENDYLQNVRKVADISFAPWNLAGIAASIVSAYQREQGRLATRNHARAVSKHIGTIGKRETFTLTVERINTIDGAYGRTNIHSFRDQDGNVVKWFASAECLDAGETYTVTGKVMKHGEYNGIAETTLNRCKCAKVRVAA